MLKVKALAKNTVFSNFCAVLIFQRDQILLLNSIKYRFSFSLRKLFSCTEKYTNKKNNSKMRPLESFAIC
jgi:hypothetical protein